MIIFLESTIKSVTRNLICKSNNSSYHEDTSAFLRSFLLKKPQLNSVEPSRRYPQVTSWAPPNLRHKGRLKSIFWGNALVEVLRMSFEGPSSNILRTLWDHLWDIPKLHFIFFYLGSIQ